MLIVCYGITKSGSTLAFELVKGMLTEAGKPQPRLSDGLVAPGHAINFVDRWDTEVVTGLVAATAGTAIAVKTHSDIDADTYMLLEQYHRQREVQVIASYRDPREIALSLVDAGEQARRKQRRPFSEFTDLASTYQRLEKQIGIFQKWASIRGAVRLNYRTLAFSPDEVLAVLERALGVAPDREAVKRHAFETAFTQKNKAVKDRHLLELTPEQDREMVRRFSPFINRVVRNNDESWFTVFRARFLASAARKAATQ